MYAPFPFSGRTHSAVSPLTVATNAAVLPSGERAMPPRAVPKKNAPPSGGLIETRKTGASAAGWQKRDTIQSPASAASTNAAAIAAIHQRRAGVDGAIAG